MAVDSNLLAVCELLLGAAYADGTGEGTEIAEVKDLMREIVDGALPDEMEKRISGFSVKSFDLAKSAKAFLDGPKITPRRMLELIATVRDADGEIDLAEDEYLRKVGSALGLKESEYADLALDFEMEEVKAAYRPPAPPKK